MTTNHEHYEALKVYAQRLKNAAHGQKQSVIDEACAFFGWNHHKLYRELKRLNLFVTKRKPRADKGSTSQDLEALNKVAALQRAGRRANGKQMMETPNAVSILSQNGYDFKSVSTVNRLLKVKNMNAKSLHRAEPCQQLKSLHPNHVHQIDPSLCVIYYDPATKDVKRIQNFANEDAFYKNKPEAFTKTKDLRVWRYVATDHTSGAIYVKYYAAAGESMKLVADFMLWCWIKQAEREMFGLPLICLVDKGTANIAKPVSNMCQSVGVQLITHAPRKSRVKGSVENANNIVEKHFESRLLLEPLKSVDEMNEAVLAWQNAYNANKIPNYNAKHTRHKKARIDVWRTIHSAAYRQHLRICPPEEICRMMLSYEPVERVVKNDYTISFKHPAAIGSLDYKLAGLHGVLIGEKVKVSPIILGGSLDITVFVIDPLTDKEIAHRVEQVEYDQFGFALDATVIGEGFSRLADDEIALRQKEADRLAYPGLSDDEIAKAKMKNNTPFNGELDAHSHLKHIQHETAFATKGNEIDLPEVFKPKGEKPLSNLAARIAVAEFLKRDLTAFEADFINDQEVFDSTIHSVVSQIKAGLCVPKPTLRLVGE